MSNIVKFNDNPLTQEQWTLIKKYIAPKASDAEIEYFLGICGQRGINPFSGNKVYFIPFYNDEAKSYKHTMIVSIDYLREHAAATGLYGGQNAPLWYDLENNKWVDIWTSKTTKPHAAKVSVYRKDITEPFTHTAYFEAHNTGKNQWVKNYANMLAKCAEAGALRKAFPDGLSGLYINEEMEHNVKKGSKYDKQLSL